MELGPPRLCGESEGPRQPVSAAAKAQFSPFFLSVFSLSAPLLVWVRVRVWVCLSACQARVKRKHREILCRRDQRPSQERKKLTNAEQRISKLTVNLSANVIYIINIFRESINECAVFPCCSSVCERERSTGRDEGEKPQAGCRENPESKWPGKDFFRITFLLVSI